MGEGINNTFAFLFNSFRVPKQAGIKGHKKFIHYLADV